MPTSPLRNDVVKDFQASGCQHDTVHFSRSVFQNCAGVLAHATQVGRGHRPAELDGVNLSYVLAKGKVQSFDMWDDVLSKVHRTAELASKVIGVNR